MVPGLDDMNDQNNHPRNGSSSLVPVASRGNHQLAPMASHPAFADFPEPTAS